LLTLFVGNLSLFNVIIAIIIVPRIIKDINSIMIIIILQIIIIEIVPIVIVKIIIKTIIMIIVIRIIMKLIIVIIIIKTVIMIIVYKDHNKNIYCLILDYISYCIYYCYKD